MHGVIGPGGRGVVVIDEDPVTVLETKRWLAEEGIPAVEPPEAGLRTKGGGPYPFWLGQRRQQETWFWASALRRPSVSVERDHVTIAYPTPEGREVGRDDAVREIRAAMDSPLPPRVAVFGGAWVHEDEPEYREAMTFGRLCAGGHIQIVNGGYGGIMAAVSRGAAEAMASATVVGVTIGSFSEQVTVNPWLTHEVEAVDLFARLPLICDAEAWVAFPGGVGTLSEVALAWNLVQTESVTPRPLVIVGERWDHGLKTFRELLLAEDVHFDLVRPAISAVDAFDRLRDLASG